MKSVLIFQIIAFLLLAIMLPERIIDLMNEENQLDSYQQNQADNPVQEPYVIATYDFDDKTIYFMYVPQWYSVYAGESTEIPFMYNRNPIPNKDNTLYFYAEASNTIYHNEDGPIEPVDTIEYSDENVTYSARIYHFSPEKTVFGKHPANTEDYEFRCMTNIGCNADNINTDQLVKMMEDWKVIDKTEGLRYQKQMTSYFSIYPAFYQFRLTTLEKYVPTLNLYFLIYTNELEETILFCRRDGEVTYYKLSEKQKSELDKLLIK